MSADLKGRAALVTGATSGIGRGVAQALAAAGAHVIVHGRDAARGAQVVDAITRAGGAADFLAADLAEGSGTITRLAARAADLAGGPIDILVNNAAYLVGQTAATDTTEAMIDTALAVPPGVPDLHSRRGAVEADHFRRPAHRHRRARAGASSSSSLASADVSRGTCVFPGYLPVLGAPSAGNVDGRGQCDRRDGASESPTARSEPRNPVTWNSEALSAQSFIRTARHGM